MTEGGKGPCISDWRSEPAQRFCGRGVGARALGLGGGVDDRGIARGHGGLVVGSER